MLPQLEQRQNLLGTGDDRQLLGGHRVEPGDVEHREQVALDLRPRLFEPELGVDLLHVEPLGHPGRLRPDLYAERVCQRVGGVRREHERAVAGRGGERRGTGRDRGLADAALPGEEEDPHDVSSTRFFSPLSAVSMRIFSPLRLSMPMSGMVTSSASR